MTYIEHIMTHIYCKNGDGGGGRGDGVHLVGLSVKGKDMQCFSLTVYGFRISNILYSASLSFILILSHLDT